MNDYKIEYVNVGDLIPYEKNAKKHPAEQVDQIAESIKQFGFRQNLVIDASMEEIRSEHEEGQNNE